MTDMKSMPDIMILSPVHGNFGEPMIAALARSGCRFRQCTRIDELLPALAAAAHRIVVIDVADGCAATAAIRSRFKGGILLFTGNASEDRERGLNSGADSVLSSPCRPQEVIAYLFALHRRIQTMQAGLRDLVPFWERDGAGAGESVWALEENGWFLRSPGGRKTRLTRAEWTFLILLFEDREHLLRRERWREIQGRSTPGSRPVDKRIDVLVSRLRKKVEAINDDFPLHTRHGTGYQFLGSCLVDYAVRPA